MKRVLLLSVLALAVGVSEAGAETRVVPPNSGEPSGHESLYQGWIDAAWVPTPPVELTVLPHSCTVPPRPYACAYPSGYACDVWPYAPPGCWDGYTIEMPLPIRRLFAHELGHVFDFNALNEAGERLKLAKLLRTPVWDVWARASTSAERFADLYSGCLLGGRKKAWFEVTRKLWSRATFKRGCRLIRAAV